MARPSKVRIGYQDFTILWFSEDDWYLHRYSDDAQAETSSDRNEIAMRTGPIDRPINEDYMRETLMHEIMHAVLGLQQTLEFVKHVEKNDIEEFLIRSTSPGLFTVLTEPRNVKVRDYILGL